MTATLAEYTSFIAGEIDKWGQVDPLRRHQPE
jgi:hypothetical protein